jgi:hypothetical protein
MNRSFSLDLKRFREEFSMLTTKEGRSVFQFFFVLSIKSGEIIAESIINKIINTTNKKYFFSPVKY